MPIGIQRLNARKSQPNNLIIFIKPLKGPDEAIARDLLERIAAQCRKSAAGVSAHTIHLKYVEHPNSDVLQYQS